jgi:hypothetical protein
MEMSLKDVQKSHAFFMAVTKQAKEEYQIPLDHVYNADQRGLFYNKLPNCMYVSKGSPSHEADEEPRYVTPMVAISAAGAKIPLFMVGSPSNLSASSCVLETFLP